MGTIISSIYIEGTKPDVIPDSGQKPTYDPSLGFQAPRKERVSKLTEQEMKALRIPKDKRDYCAHLYRDLTICLRKYQPIYGLCNPELHLYKHCEVEDYIIRMKEFEREKRLRMRDARKQIKIDA